MGTFQQLFEVRAASTQHHLVSSQGLPPCRQGHVNKVLIFKQTFECICQGGLEQGNTLDKLQSDRNQGQKFCLNHKISFFLGYFIVSHPVQKIHLSLTNVTQILCILYIGAIFIMRQCCKIQIVKQCIYCMFSSLTDY